MLVKHSLGVFDFAESNNRNACRHVVYSTLQEKVVTNRVYIFIWFILCMSSMYVYLFILSFCGKRVRALALNSRGTWFKTIKTKRSTFIFFTDFLNMITHSSGVHSTSCMLINSVGHDNQWIMIEKLYFLNIQCTILIPKFEKVLTIY